MLGCHDFCGYYDWTFRHLQREFGQAAVERLWAEAIGAESQSHYLRAALRSGLRGLYESWVRTGKNECCDWTFTLDEERNVLRWDMRNCPSKGFLLQNDLNAHTDYCDHCMGWIVPLLERAGVQVQAHQHNHCGQCWAEMSVKGKRFTPLHLPQDIRNDPRWRRGYIDSWVEDEKQPFAPERSEAVDSADALADALRPFARFAVVAADAAGASLDTPDYEGAAILMTGAAYARGARSSGAAIAVVLIEPGSADLPALAARYRAGRADERPLLLYGYFPTAIEIDFLAHDLPRPLPILPLLIRRGVFAHVPGKPPPSAQSLLILLARALNKPVILQDISEDATP